MENIIESDNYMLAKIEEEHIIGDINLLLRQYETLLKSSDSNEKKIANGSMICEYMLNLLLQKRGFLIKSNTPLESIAEFAKFKRIIPSQCASFLNAIALYRKNSSLDYPDDLLDSFLKAFAYYITWFNSTYSGHNLFNIENCFEIIDSKSDSKLFSIDSAVRRGPMSYKSSSAKFEVNGGNMILCPGCGREIESGVNFCPHCRHEFSRKDSISERIRKSMSKNQEDEVKRQEMPQTNVNSRYAERMNENLILEMLGEQNESMKTILETVLETLTIVEDINAKLDVISNNLNRIQSQSEKLIRTAWSEEEIDRIIEVHTTECVENILEYKREISTDAQFRQEEAKLIESFGQDTWDKLSDDSKTFLITAKFMYNRFLELEEQIDYSGVCVLVTKSLEVEIFKRFFKNFIEYLDEKYERDYTKYHTALLYNKEKPLRSERFTMGNIAFVMCKKQRWEDSEEEIENNKERLMEYCRERVFSNNSTKEIERMLDSYASSIEMIKHKYRNPSAHRNHIRRKTAQECFDLIVDVHKLLKEMLDSFDE